MKLAVICASDEKKFTYDDILTGLTINQIQVAKVKELILISRHPLMPLLAQFAELNGLGYQTVKTLTAASKKATKILVLHNYNTKLKTSQSLLPKEATKKTVGYEVGSVSFVTNMLWVPAKLVEEDTVREHFDRRMYDESKCAKCPYLESRHDPDTCDPCSGYKGRIVAYQKRKVGGRQFVGLPIGAKTDIKKVLADHKSAYKSAVDARPAIPASMPIKFSGELRSYQDKAVTKLTATPSSGILRSAPRTGKTIMSMALIARNGLKTIFLAAQEDWLKQAHKEAKRFTNLTRTKKIGFCKKLADFKKYDVCLVTYQSFLSPGGQKLLEQVRHMFGLLIVDEVHMSAADKFSSVVNSFNCKWKFGLTAEVERKDQRHWLCFSIFGPIKVETTVETLRPLVQIEELPCVPPTSYKLWHYGMDWMARDGKRNRLILKQLLKDIDAGRHIVVPVVRVSHAIGLADAINRLRPGAAMAFHGKSNRDKILKLAISGEIKVVTGIRSITSTGINVPRWDTLYVIIPQSNPPKQYQELSRIATPMEGKPTPIIRHFISKWGAEISCLRTCMQGYRQHCSVSKRTEMVYKQLTDRGRPGRGNPFS